MRNGVFLDTNVLVYAAAGNRNEPAKWQTAQALLGREDAGLSAQVLAEFYAVCTGKGYLGSGEAALWVERLAMKPLIATDAALVLAGAIVSQRHHISYWDGAIVAAAERMGAKTLYTEDLDHDQLYGSVRVINPFREV